MIDGEWKLYSRMSPKGPPRHLLHKSDQNRCVGGCRSVGSIRLKIAIAGNGGVFSLNGMQCWWCAHAADATDRLLAGRQLPFRREMFLYPLAASAAATVVAITNLNQQQPRWTATGHANGDMQSAGDVEVAPILPFFTVIDRFAFNLISRFQRANSSRSIGGCSAALGMGGGMEESLAVIGGCARFEPIVDVHIQHPLQGMGFFQNCQLSKFSI